MKLLQYILISIFIVLIFSCSLNPAEDKFEPTTIEFPDPNFEALIRETLDKPEGDITDVDMWGITLLMDGENRNITDITGIRYCTGLQRLNFRDNSIQDISQLSDLVLLNYVNLAANIISDIEPLTLNDGIGIGDDIIYLLDNPLSDKSILDYKPFIQSKGVKLYSNSIVSKPGTINFKDDNFENIIRQNLNIYDTDVLTNHMFSIKDLDGSNQNISNVYGIGFCSDIEYLNLGRTNISDLIPLFYLRKINNLFIDNNKISDISSLRYLNELESLSIENNNIKNISYLSDLNKIKYLNLSGNPIINYNILEELDSLEFLEIRNLSSFNIDDITNLSKLNFVSLSNTPVINFESIASLNEITALFIDNCSLGNIDSLASLGKLRKLNINGNSIVDIESLSTLYDISELDLGNNQISNILPLLNNYGLGNGDFLFIQNNPLSEESINTYIPILEGRGVTVVY